MREWTELKPGALQIVEGSGTDDQFQPYWIPPKNPIVGAGLHQFEIRTRAGAEKIESLETWAALYLIDIVC